MVGRGPELVGANRRDLCKAVRESQHQPSSFLLPDAHVPLFQTHAQYPKYHISCYSGLIHQWQGDLAHTLFYFHMNFVGDYVNSSLPNQSVYAGSLAQRWTGGDPRMHEL